MLRSEKKDFVSGLEQIYKDSDSVIITHYHGLTVAQITNLRKSLRDKGAGFKVVKNTLCRIAAVNAKVNCDPKLFSGPTAIAYSSDPVTAAKCVVEFIKANENLKIIGGIVDNNIMSINDVQLLAKLPSLDELRSKLIGVLQAPATNLARVISAPASQLARLCQAYANK